MNFFAISTERWITIVAFCLASSLGIPAAPAHEVGTSRFDLDIGERTIDSRLHIDFLTFLRMVPDLDGNRDHQISLQEAQTGAAQVAAFLGENVSFDIDGEEMNHWGEALPIVWPNAEGQPVAQAEYHQLLVQFPFRRKIDGRPADVRVTFDVFVEFGGNHRIFGDIGCGEQARQAIVFNHLEPDYLFDVDYALEKQAHAALLKPGAKLFTDRDYTLTEAPEFLLGRRFVKTSIEGYEAECLEPGEVFVMTLSKPHSANRSGDLRVMGFERIDSPEFQLFPGEINRVFAWRKEVKQGELLHFRKLAFMVCGEKTEMVVKQSGAESEADKAARIERMEKIADLALVPPTPNTTPLPEYGYDRLDYGMTIGIERTPGGRLWACWVAGGDSPKAYFVLASSDDDGESWSDPRLVLDSHSEDLPMDRSILVGNLWTDPLGRLWLIFDQSMHMFDGRAGVWATVCENPDADEPAWSEPRRIWHGVTLNKPTVLSNGEWMLPISLDQREGFGPFKGCFKELDPMRGANVFVSADQGETWQRRGAAVFPDPDWHEHMIVERENGSLWMLARTRPGIMESTSTDGGRTWSAPVEPPGIRQPNARFHVRRLASGRILLVKHGDQIDAHQGRVQLSAWLSEDEGKSWQGGLVLDERKGISYPDGFQAPDGSIYISYDRNRATDGEILMARFTEDDVLAGKLVAPASRLKMLISRPLAGKDAD